jgi:hypothetical protein
VKSALGEDSGASAVETGRVGSARYRIVVRDRLSERFVQTLEGVTLEQGPQGTTLIAKLRDQSELYGVLERLRGRGVELVSLNVIP